jgi:predicted Zn-dependent protease
VQPDRAHSGLLDIALVGGLPAALLYGGFLAAIVVHLRRRVRRTAVSPPLLGALAAIAAYVAQQQLLFPLAETEPVLFLLAGGLVCTGQPTVRISRSVARVAAAGLGAAAIAALWWGARDVTAWHAANDAVEAAARGDRAAADEHARVAVARRDDEVWLHLLASRTAATPEEALKAVDAALDLSPGDPIALTRREELLVTLDPATAFEELHDLVGNDPNNAALQQLYGTAAVRTGDEAIAEQAWRRSLQLAPTASGPRANLITLYRQQGRDAEADALQNSGNP